MPIRLFHRTTSNAVESILQSGFNDGIDSGVWFSKRLDCWGEQGRHLMEICLDFTEEELSRYAIEAVADEVWDSTIKDWVKVKAKDEIENFVWFEIPSAVINPRCRIRYVPPEEARWIELNWDLYLEQWAFEVEN